MVLQASESGLLYKATSFHRWRATAIKSTVRQHIEVVLKDLAASKGKQTRLQRELQAAQDAQQEAYSRADSARSETASALDELQQLVARQEVLTGQLERAYDSNTSLAARAGAAETELQHLKVSQVAHGGKQTQRAGRLQHDLNAAGFQRQSILDALARRSEQVRLAAALCHLAQTEQTDSIESNHRSCHGGLREWEP